MPREPSRRLRALVWTCLAGGSFAAASCRIGYEGDVGPAGVAGFAGSAGAETASGGGGGSNGGGAAASPGGGVVGGASDAPLGGGAANGGDSSAAAGGDAGSTAAAGAGGDGPSAPSCAATTDCSCASNGGHAYWFCQGALEWDAAEAQCETQSMQLVRIDSQQENDFLVSRGTASGVFQLNGFAQIGANDRAVAGEWRWSDGELFWQGGSAGSPVAGLFSNWLATSPSTSGVQQCSGLLETGKWQVRSCTAVVPFICESL